MLIALKVGSERESARARVARARVGLRLRGWMCKRRGQRGGDGVAGCCAKVWEVGQIPEVPPVSGNRAISVILLGVICKRPPRAYTPAYVMGGRGGLLPLRPAAGGGALTLTLTRRPPDASTLLTLLHYGGGRRWPTVHVTHRLRHLQPLAAVRAWALVVCPSKQLEWRRSPSSRLHICRWTQM